MNGQRRHQGPCALSRAPLFLLFSSPMSSSPKYGSEEEKSASGYDHEAAVPVLDSGADNGTARRFIGSAGGETTRGMMSRHLTFIAIGGTIVRRI